METKDVYSEGRTYYKLHVESMTYIMSLPRCCRFLSVCEKSGDESLFPTIIVLKVRRSPVLLESERQAGNWSPLSPPPCCLSTGIDLILCS